MLKGLYDLGIQGKEEEFTAYRILMLIHGRNRSGARLRSFLVHPPCLMIGCSLLPRLESLCRSTNPQTEIRSCCEARPVCATCTFHGQLPRSV